MPEGDTIFRTAESLKKALLGRILTGFDTSLESIKEIASYNPVVGRSLHAIQPIGKHLLMVFRQPSIPENGILREPVEPPSGLELELIRGDVVLHTHMRMTGSWHIYRPHEAWRKPASFARVVLRTDAYVAPCFSAPVVELLTARETIRHPMITSRGPDAITQDFDFDTAFQTMRRHADVPIGVALMNQRIMAGVGNVFKSEVMYIRRVNPFALVGAFDDESLMSLIQECYKLLRLNRNRTIRQTRFALDSKARLWVYGRSGEQCYTCGTSIKMRRQGLDGRSTYYCPNCQNVVL
jgi:endonuclease-8